MSGSEHTHTHTHSKCLVFDRSNRLAGLIYEINGEVIHFPLRQQYLAPSPGAEGDKGQTRERERERERELPKWTHLNSTIIHSDDW